MRIKEFIINCIEEKRASYANNMEEKYPPCILDRTVNQEALKEHNDSCDLAVEMVKKMFNEKNNKKEK